MVDVFAVVARGVGISVDDAAGVVSASDAVEDDNVFAPV